MKQIGLRLYHVRSSQIVTTNGFDSARVLVLFESIAHPAATGKGWPTISNIEAVWRAYALGVYGSRHGSGANFFDRSMVLVCLSLYSSATGRTVPSLLILRRHDPGFAHVLKISHPTIISVEAQTRRLTCRSIGTNSTDATKSPTCPFK
jgi:hypothetical protein